MPTIFGTLKNTQLFHKQSAVCVFFLEDADIFLTLHRRTSHSCSSQVEFLLTPVHLWFSVQLHGLPSNYTELVVTGDDEGIFGVDAQFLYALKPLDREKQPSYSLQVRALRLSPHRLT